MRKVYVAIKGANNKAYLFEGEVLRLKPPYTNLYEVKFVNSIIDCYEKDLFSSPEQAKQHIAVDNEFLKQIKQESRLD